MKCVIIGSDINAYYHARCFHEYTSEKAHLIVKIPMAFTRLSKILTYEVHDNLNDEFIFLRALLDYAAQNNSPDKILLIATNDTYLKLLCSFKEELSTYYKFVTPSFEIANIFLDKELFYQKYQSDLPLPKTILYDFGSDSIPDISEFTFPIIGKPNDHTIWDNISFDNKKKVYKIHTNDEFQKVISDISSAGFSGTFIIQEFIEGDDYDLYHVDTYTNEGVSNILGFAWVGLQEHQDSAIGNDSVLISNAHSMTVTTDKIESIKATICSFLEKVNYTGFAQIDLKWDNSRQEFYLFEINPRLGRASYYISKLGYNPIKILDKGFKVSEGLAVGAGGDSDGVSGHESGGDSDKMVALSFVPNSVIKTHINNSLFVDTYLKLESENQTVHPLDYKLDISIRRKLWLYIRAKRFIKKFNENKW
ncbi:MAG: hypothetical protein LBN03_01760 [Bifidobacteriaceae bacterium]|jgi:D-aspartate ligase|nr:hypothetical protein [Bifidobacteriaceae bacterium]